MQTSPADRSESPPNGPSKTQALDALVENAGSRLGLKKAIKTSAVVEAVGLDLQLNDAVREDGQIGGVKTAVLKFLQKEESSDVRLVDVKNIRQQLSTLSGRVRFLCDTGTAGFDELLKRDRGGVLPEEVEQQFRAGLDLVLPDSKIQPNLVEAVKRKGRLANPVTAREALRREIQKRFISDAIMAKFSSLGHKRDVVPVVLEDLRVRLGDKKLTENQIPRKAGTMSEYAISELEKALKDPKFTEGVEKEVAQRRNDARDNRNVAPKRGVAPEGGIQVVGRTPTAVVKELGEELKKRA